MASKIDLLLEAERRGILPPDKAALLAEARKRGLVGQAAVSAQSAPPAPSQGVGGYLRETLGNVPESGAAMLKNMATAVLNPIDTASALGNLAIGVGQLAIPGEQGKEPIARQVGGALADRYGSIDAIANTVKTDPVGALADASTVLTLGGTGAATLPGKMGQIGRMAQRAGVAVDPLNLGANTAKVAATSVIPRSAAVKLYESAAKWRPSLPKDMRDRMTQTALREQLMPTSAGVGKAQLMIGQLADQIDGLIQTATDSGVKVPVDVVYQNLDALKAELGGFKLNAADDVAMVDKLADQFDEYVRALGKDTVTPAELQAFKQDAYKRINFDMEQGAASYAKNETAKAMARSAKTELEKIDPRIQALNAREGALLELRPELARAANRIENRDPLGLMPVLTTGAGAGIGDTAGAAAGGVLGFLNRPTMQARMALNLASIKDAGLLGNYADNSLGAYWARQGLLRGGQAQGLLGE